MSRKNAKSNGIQNDNIPKYIIYAVALLDTVLHVIYKNKEQFGSPCSDKMKIIRFLKKNYRNQSIPIFQTRNWSLLFHSFKNSILPYPPLARKKLAFDLGFFLFFSQKSTRKMSGQFDKTTSQ